ncbi:MAG: glycosyltransferase family 2 protein [Phycisphaeraceae bacterium]|nr:glycosyltransferase family 2 protein [Phycisphaeraceae bacterium]
MPRTPGSVYVVIAAYNEASVLGEVIDDVARHVPVRQVIVVDDGSTDATPAVAMSKGVRVLRHAINRGQGAALQTGIHAALLRGAGVIVTFDADHQHTADDLPAMIEPILSGQADIVLGSRFLSGDVRHIPWVRRMVLRMAVVFTRAFSRIWVTDTHNGFRAMNAEAARVIRIHQDRMAHASEIIDEIRRHRLRFVERPVHIRYTEYSLAKGQRSSQALRLLLRLIFTRLSE